MAAVDRSFSAAESDSILVSENRQLGKSGSFSSWNDGALEKKWRIERSNLLNIAKICIKTLIDTSLSAGTGRILTEDFPALEQFFVVFEHILRHGLKAKRTLLGQRKEFMAVLEALENKIGSLPDILTNIRNLSDIKTNFGRTRAWMRLSLMQKVLAEQMTIIVEEKNVLRDWYEESSLILSEEGLVIAGMLVGLNVIDCNFDLKGTDLDTQHGIIDISLYLRDGNYLEKTFEEKKPADEPDGQKFEVILDQKAYLEQLNKSLTDSVVQLKLQAKEQLKKDNNATNEVEEMRNRLVSLIAQREQYKKDYENLLEEHNRRLKTVNADLNVERETYQQSRSGLNDLYLEVKKELEKERQCRKELEILVEEHKSMNQEKEVAMRLLEKDIHDKQDTLISIRRQLEDIKKINLELHNKWQGSENSLKKHESEWHSMEQKCSRMISQTKDMEKSLSSAENQKKQAEETAHQIGAKLAQVQAEKHGLETDMKVEREWRAGLQTELDGEKEKSKQLANELKDAANSLKENEELRVRLEKAEKKCADQESALYEMGHQLNKSHTQVDEMKELHTAMKEKMWQDDKDATDCQLCQQPFSLSRRKHHCRSCGGIFCSSCSDNTMPLPSSAKPVRVCDTCQAALLARYSVGVK